MLSVYAKKSSSSSTKWWECSRIAELSCKSRLTQMHHMSFQASTITVMATPALQQKLSNGLAFVRNNCPESRCPRLEPLHVRILRCHLIPHVYQTTINDEDRTNNLCESWNRAFRQLVGYSHPTVWVAIQSIRKDAMLVTVFEPIFKMTAEESP